MRPIFAYRDRFMTEMRPIARRSPDIECELVVEDFIHAVVADAIPVVPLRVRVLLAVLCRRLVVYDEKLASRIDP
jgi:hypothetical protein